MGVDLYEDLRHLKIHTEGTHREQNELRRMMVTHISFFLLLVYEHHK